MKSFSHAELTEYPEVFKNSYWGHFKEHCEPNIISNRNNMAAAYGLISWCNAKSPFILMKESEFDHPEAYKTDRQGIVCITSLYDVHLPMWAYGFFRKVQPVYSNRAITFLAFFSSMKDVRLAIKSKRQMIAVQLAKKL